MQRAEKQTARLTNFNSKSSCPSLLLQERVYLADKPLLLKKKIKKVKESQRQQRHRKRNFPFFWLPFICFTCRFTYSRDQQGCIRGLSTTGTPYSPNPPALLLLLHSQPHPKHPALPPALPAHFPSPRESTLLAPKVWQLVILNFRAEPGSNYGEGKKSSKFWQGK